MTALKWWFVPETGRMMTKRTPDYWKNVIVYGLASWLYALALSALLTGVTEFPFSWANQAVYLLILMTFWLLILSFPRTSLTVVLGGLVLLGLSLMNQPDNMEPLLESRLFLETEATVRALLYFVGIRSYLTPETGYFLRLFAIVSSLFSVIVLWRLGWYLLAFVGLAAPLFFQLGLSGNGWLLWLSLGLFAILIVASRRRFFGRGGNNLFQRPDLVPILLLLVLTIGLGQVLPSGYFFSDRLSRWVNELDEPFRRTFEGDRRGLFTVGGGYDKTSSPINGLINRRNDPYLTVYGPAESFYLRGSVFTEFSGRTWFADEEAVWQPFSEQIDAQQLAVYDPYRTLIWLDRVISMTDPMDYTWMQEIAQRTPPEGTVSLGLGESWLEAFPTDVILVEPLYLPQSTVYGPNAYRSITPGTIDTGLASVSFTSRGESADEYQYSTAGQVTRVASDSTEAYRMEGVFVRTDNRSAEQLIQTLGLTPSTTDPAGHPVTKASLGLKRYAALVAERDPALYDILYGQLTDLNKVLQARDHLAGNYAYDLNVTSVPRNREFIDWFLDIKTGYCVHYGSALALLLEDAGIPTRYVEGFVAGATPQESDNRVYRRTVSTDQAHAWTEVYLQGIGWYPFDATPAAEVERLNQVAATPLMPSDSYRPEDDIPPEREMEDILPDRPQPEENGRPEQADSPEESSSSLDVPWRWVLLISGMIFFGWRHWIWKTRHNIGWIRWRYRGREDVMVRRIFRDIQQLHRLGGYSLPETWGSKQRFDDVLENSPALDYDNAAFAEQAIEQVYYAERIPSERQLSGLLSYHNRLEIRVRNKLSWPEWWFRRYIWSSRHPL